MDTKGLLLAIVGTLLFINSISCIPAPNNEIRHRFTRQSDNDDDNNSSSDGLASGISSVADSSSQIIENLQSILESSVKILRDILEAKRRIGEPLLEATGRTLEALSESKAIERTLETVGVVAAAGIQASSGISTALSRAGTSATPALVEGISSASDIGGRVIRLAICTIICPLRNGEERKTCQKEHCGKIDKSDNLDEYDGDYVEIADDV